MFDQPTELAGEESFVVTDEADQLVVETTCTDEHLFTVTQWNFDTGALGFVLEMDSLY